MTNDPKEPQPGMGGAEPAPPKTAPGEPAPSKPASSAAAPATGEVEALRAEVADLKDRLLRAHAEMDNIRKRTDREKSEAHKYAVSRFARDIVNVGDNFQRAISAVPTSAVDQTPALKSFLEGVTMTEREFLNVLERHGVKRVDPQGETFNPHLHQAVMEQDNKDVPAGTVVQVFQPGYTIEERVLRPAMVVVAKGGFKPARPAEPAASPGAPANDDQPAGQPPPGQA